MSKEATIRVRMSARDAHYGGNLVPGAKMLEIFGDLITDLAIQQDGDEGLFRAYHEVEFLAASSRPTRSLRCGPTSMTRRRTYSKSRFSSAERLAPRSFPRR